jgi:hypothetical protein
MTIWTEKGYVNPRHVIMVGRYSKGQQGRGGYLLHLTDGTTVTAYGDDDSEIAQHLGAVIPAKEGWDLLITWLDEDSGTFLEYRHEPIIAWRIHRDDPNPITADGSERISSPTAIRYPNGRVYDVDGYHKDADEWLAQLNKDAAEEAARKAAS